MSAPEGKAPRAPDGSPNPHPLIGRILHETARFATLQVLSAVLAGVANIALARLLDRRDFGVFGICSFYIGIGALLGNGGLGATLLRRREQVRVEEYQATLTALLSVSVVLALGLFFGAPWIAEQNQLTRGETQVLRAMSPLFIFSALRVVPYVRLERELSLSVIARLELIAAVVRHVLAILVAAIVGSVWALVASHLVGNVVQLWLAYRAAPGWVGLGWSWRVFRPLVSYGVKVQALSIFSYLKNNVSRALLGRQLGPAPVGLFDFGIAYIGIPVVAVNGLARAQLPVYAQFDARDPALSRALRGAMRTAALLGIPALGALALGATWLIPTIYGDQWTTSLPVVRGLLLNMVCGLILSPLFTLLQGQGRAGLAIIVFGSWTTVTWALALGALWIAPGDLGLLAHVYSAATLGVTAYLLVWATRHLGTNATSGLANPVLAGSAALALGFVAERWAGAYLGHPLAATAWFLIVYVGLLLLLEGRTVLDEAKAIARNIRRPARSESQEINPSPS